MDNPANYFKTYRLELGFSNQSDAKFFLAAKDITPDIDYAYITLLNERLIKILKNLNKILVGDLKNNDLKLFSEKYITRPYEILKNNDIISKLNNQGRRPEQVLFSWLRGFALVELFKPIFAKLFSIDVALMVNIGDDDLKNIDTFKRTPTADLQIQKNGEIINIEVQTGFQGINDIKEHKVREAKKVSQNNGIKTICIHRDLCINMNNHQNAIFHQLDNFIKHSHSFAMTIFHKITKSAKLVILLIIPTYAKVSHIDIFNGQVAFIRLDSIKDNDINFVTRQQMEGQSVFSIDQNYFKWRLLDALPSLKELGVGL